MPSRDQTKVKKQNFTYAIDATQPIVDGLFDPTEFVKFLHDRIKVDGKTGNLGSAIAIKQEKNKVSVHANINFSKRYLKYLVKKFLKKKQLRDWLHVIASDKNTYTLKYFNINENVPGAETESNPEK